MNCPNCQTPNDPDNRFCLKCGTPLKTAAPPARPAPASAPVAPRPVQAPASWTALATPAPAPRYPTVAPDLPPPTYVPPQQPYYGAPGANALNIWGPFATYGMRRRHVGWLMDGEGQRANELAARVEAKFKEREIPNTRLSRETLIGRGVVVETRPYFILRRGLASLALYIAQFGRDLFISQASYLKPPISNFRVMVAAVMLFFQGYMTLIYPFSLASAFDRAANSFSVFGGSSSNAFGGVLTLLCLIGPLGAFNAIALFILFCFSAYKWLIEKDFLSALRVPPNEFNEDDLMAMEKAVEETVRQSLTELKLDPDNLKMATARQGAQLF